MYFIPSAHHIGIDMAVHLSQTELAIVIACLRSESTMQDKASQLENLLNTFRLGNSEESVSSFLYPVLVTLILLFQIFLLSKVSPATQTPSLRVPASPHLLSTSPSPLPSPLQLPSLRVPASPLQAPSSLQATRSHSTDTPSLLTTALVSPKLTLVQSSIHYLLTASSPSKYQWQVYLRWCRDTGTFVNLSASMMACKLVHRKKRQLHSRRRRHRGS